MGANVALLFEILVLFDLAGEVKGVANARRRYLSSTQHLHSQSFSQRLHGLQGLRQAGGAAVPQQAVLHKNVPLSSRHYVVPIEQVMALAVLHRQVVVIARHPLVAPLTDVDVGCARWQHDHEIVAVPAYQTI